jgi:tripartite-type tricarboxylate transporter receptor subunit TctC
VLAVFDNRRIEQLPDVPTAKESGWDVEAYAWYCLVAPSATPPETITRLNRLVNQILEGKEFAERAKSLGVERRGGSPQDLARYIKSEYDRWAPMLTDLGLAKSL